MWVIVDQHYGVIKEIVGPFESDGDAEDYITENPDKVSPDLVVVMEVVEP